MTLTARNIIICPHCRAMLYEVPEGLEMTFHGQVYCRHCETRTDVSQVLILHGPMF